MEFTSEDAAPVAFAAPADELEYAIEARSGEGRAEDRLVRRWLRPGATREQVEGEGFVGTLFLPPGGPGVGVLIVPGSTGRAAIEPLGALLASRGYSTLVAAYMEERGLPGSLREIPLEVITRALDALTADGRSRGSNVGVIGVSVGTQGALAALALEQPANVRCAIALAPASVIWQALSSHGPPPKTAAFSRGGEPLPWLAMHGERVVPEVVKHALLDRLSRHPRPKALHLRQTYEPSLADTNAAERAAIPVERIPCPLMLVSGEDDQMWPGAEMAEGIARRRQGSAAGAGDRYLRFPDAGHFVRPPVIPTTVHWNDAFVSGGTAAGDARMYAEAWRALLDFLGDHLGAADPDGERGP
jgi:fermentation-respiration switch protein FrsA (DUF1100 family)